MWPRSQPFSSEKCPESLWFYFDPVRGFVNNRPIKVFFTLKVTYKFLTYHIENPLSTRGAKVMSNTGPFRTTNFENYGSPMYVQKNLIDPRTRKATMMSGAFQRMFIAKPMIHYYKIPEPTPYLKQPFDDSPGEESNKRIKL